MPASSHPSTRMVLDKRRVFPRVTGVDASPSTEIDREGALKIACRQPVGRRAIWVDGTKRYLFACGEVL